MSVPWSLFLDKWVPLKEIALPQSLINQPLPETSEVLAMPPEVLIAIILPIRKPEIIFRQMSCGLEETFVFLANPVLKAAYEIKLNLEYM